MVDEQNDTTSIMTDADPSTRRSNQSETRLSHPRAELVNNVNHQDGVIENDGLAATQSTNTLSTTSSQRSQASIEAFLAKVREAGVLAPGAIVSMPSYCSENMYCGQIAQVCFTLDESIEEDVPNNAAAASTTTSSTGGSDSSNEDIGSQGQRALDTEPEQEGTL